MTADSGFISGVDLMDITCPSIYMLTDFFPSRAFIVVAGLPGAGKTEFLIHQAIKAASKGVVIFFWHEGGVGDIQQRQNAYCKDKDVLKNLLWVQRRWPNFKDSDGVVHLETVIKRFKPIAIFFDPGPDAFGNENDAELLKEPLQQIYDLVEVYQFCLVFSWHPPKNQLTPGVYGIRGSTTIPGKSDLMYDLTLEKKKPTLILHKLRLTRPELNQGQKWNIERTENEKGRLLKFTDTQELSKTLFEEKQRKEIDALSEFMPGTTYTKADFVKIFEKHLKHKVSESTSKRLLARFQESGFFSVKEKHKGTRPSLYLFNGIDTF